MVSLSVSCINNPQPYLSKIVRLKIKCGLPKGSELIMHLFVFTAAHNNTTMSRFWAAGGSSSESDSSDDDSYSSSDSSAGPRATENKWADLSDDSGA